MFLNEVKVFLVAGNEIFANAWMTGDNDNPAYHESEKAPRQEV